MMRNNNRGGLTIVEVVVAMGLFGIIMVTLFPAFLLTANVDLVSKEFTDANTLTQSEMEYIYFKTKSMTTLTEVITDIRLNKAYTCPTPVGTSGTCTKTVNGFLYTLIYTANSPQINVAKVNLTVASTSGDYQGNRAQIEVLLRLKE